MLNGLQPWHLIILVLIVVLLFGAKRLPDAARSIGKSMKIFRAETKDMKDREDAEAEEADTKQLPSATAESATTESATADPTSGDQRVADLQRQLEELRKQQEQSQKHAS